MNTEKIIGYMDNGLSIDDIEKIQAALTTQKLKTLGVQFGMENSLQMKESQRLCALAKKRYSLAELETRLGKQIDLI